MPAESGAGWEGTSSTGWGRNQFLVLTVYTGRCRRSSCKTSELCAGCAISQYLNKGLVHEAKPFKDYKYK